MPCRLPKCRIGTTARVVRVAATGVVYLLAKGLRTPMRVPVFALGCLERLR